MSDKVNIEMGNLPLGWNQGVAKSITFCVTEDCNLACKYCYMTGKNSKKKMSFETAKKAVDWILSDREYFKEPSIVWEFIGGEPFLEIDLIDKICDYIKQQMFILDHPWFNSYRFNFSTNGTLYHTKKVQDFIKKNHLHLSIGISIDGNKIKHDLQRVKRDGSGSYDDVVKNVPLWMEQFPWNSTKATFAHDDLPYLKDSIISLWNLGIKKIAANVVFEDVWEDGDDEILEQQLNELGEYILENNLWGDHSVRFFDPQMGYPLADSDKIKNFCGSGKMLAIDCDGNLFPCVRFLDFCVTNRKGRSIGNVGNGIDQNKVRPFLALSLECQSKPECIDCDVANGCAWCQGYNYDSADTDTIYQRATYLCKMHKATVRANKRFWEKFEQVTGLVSRRKEVEKIRKTYPGIKHEYKYLQFISSDRITPHCNYRNTKNYDSVMSRKTFEKGLNFCHEKGFFPVMLGIPEYIDQYTDEKYFVIDSANSDASNNNIPIHDNTVHATDKSANSILLVNKSNLSRLYTLTEELYRYSERVNLILENIEDWQDKDLKTYEAELQKLVKFLEEAYRDGTKFELNVLTDLWNLNSMRNCTAGNDTFSLAPNGRIYICPAFYFDDQDSHVGSLENGIEVKNKQLLELKNAPICSVCDVHHCMRCKYLNKKLTEEYNVPSQIQCLVSHIERNKSMELQRLIRQNKAEKFDNILAEVDYTDPLDKLLLRKVNG